MAEEFTPITFNSQEEYDAAFSAEGFRERLSRQSKKHNNELVTLNERIAELMEENEKLANSKNESTEKFKSYDEQISKLNAENSSLRSAAVKRDIAEEFGLPKEIIDRIQGTTAEEIREDAEKLAAVFANQVKPVAPLAATEEPTPSKSDALNAWLKSQRN